MQRRILVSLCFLIACGSKDDPSKSGGAAGGSAAPTDPFVAWEGVTRQLAQIALDTVAGKPVSGRFICPDHRFRGGDAMTFDDLQGMNRVVLVTSRLSVEFGMGGAHAERGALNLTVESGPKLPARFVDHVDGQWGKTMLEVDAALPEAVALARQFRSIVQKPGCPGYSPPASSELVKQLELPAWFDGNYFDDRPPNPDVCKWAARHFQFVGNDDHVGLADDARVTVLLTDGTRYGRIDATLERMTSTRAEDGQLMCLVIDGGDALEMK